MAGITATDFIWKNGEFIKWEDAQVHVLSHSMQFGSAAFEGIRCYSTPKGPAIFRLREHVQRLINSVKIYRITLEYSLEQLMAAHCEVVVRNKMEACYIRPMVVRGYGASGMVPFESPIDVYVPCWPWGAYLGDDALENGVDACVSSWNRMAPNTVPSLAKIAGNYLSGQLVKMEALTNGFAEGIALGPGGTVSEGLWPECVSRQQWDVDHHPARRHAAGRHHARQHHRTGGTGRHPRARTADPARNAVHGRRGLLHGEPRPS
jgi:branched-chain amino acid aminotransferase